LAQRATLRRIGVNTMAGKASKTSANVIAKKAAARRVAAKAATSTHDRYPRGASAGPQKATGFAAARKSTVPCHVSPCWGGLGQPLTPSHCPRTLHPCSSGE
jgi:hypothetical protein